MRFSSVLKPNRIALLIAALYAPASFAAIAARVEFSTGDAVLLGSDGKERPIKKGDVISPGERIRTRSGRVQLSFTDGAFVSLQPETDFGVDQYEFQGKVDGTEKGFFSMLKGSLRTITGLIGRGKRDAYRMQTPTATIGIRGTGGLVQVNDAGTYIFGTSGTWTLTNNAGTLNIPAGTPGFAGSSGNTPPQTGGTVPSAPPPGGTSSETTEVTYVSADQTTSSGTSAAVGTTKLMAGGPGYAVRYVADPSVSPTLSSSSTTLFSGSDLSSFTQTPSYTFVPSTAAVTNTFNDGIIGWGRWSGPGSYSDGITTYPLTVNQSLHYVVGIPTASMPVSGTGNYSMMGGTQPTETSGTWAPGTLNSASFTVNFASAAITAFSLGFTINGGNYNLSGISGSVSGNTLTASVSQGGGICGSSGCNGTVQGTFYGTGAERAGIVYSVYNGDLSKTITGAAGLKQ